MAHAKLCGAHPLLSDERPFPGTITDWTTLLAAGISDQEAERLRINSSTGRPTGSVEFVKSLEHETGLILRAQKSGRKPKCVAELELTGDLSG